MNTIETAMKLLEENMIRKYAHKIAPAPQSETYGEGSMDILKRFVVPVLEQVNEHQTLTPEVFADQMEAAIRPLIRDGDPARLVQLGEVISKLHSIVMDYILEDIAKDMEQRDV